MGDAARRRLYTPATSRLLCQLWDGVCQWATAHEVTTVSLALTDGVGGSFAESLGRCADVPPLFQIGSQSKVLTAHLIATALSQHGIGIDQPVLDWWPDGRLFLPARFRGTTTRALLSHRTGGFATEEREMQRNDGRHLPKVGSLAPEDLLRHLLSYRPAPSKEAPFVYSDIAYALLALAIKRALGQSLEDLSRQHIEAAGVSDVYCAVHSVPRPRAGALVPGRVDDGGQGQLVPPVDLGALNPALGYVASASGIASIYRRVLDNSAWRNICQRSALSIRTDRAFPRYSLGLTHFGHNPKGFDILGHVGIYNGCTGATLYDPGLRIAASVQFDRINLDAGPGGAYRMIFAERFLMALLRTIKGVRSAPKQKPDGAVRSVIRRLSL